MKKVISVSMVIAMIFILSACSSAEYTETPVTEIVTDENGETVTDAQGNAVTEVVTDENGNTKTETKKNITASDNGKNTTASKNDSQNNDGNNGGNSGNNGGNGNSGNSNNSGSNNGNNQGGNGSDNNNASDKDDPTQPTEKPEKPKKRDVTITVNLPYYNGKETKLTLYYKVEDDKEYTAFEPVELKLDNKGDNKKQEFKIEDVKGEIYAYIELEGVPITHNSITIPATGENQYAGTITPVTGIEIMDGGMD